MTPFVTVHLPGHRTEMNERFPERAYEIKGKETSLLCGQGGAMAVLCTLGSFRGAWLLFGRSAQAQHRL